ncbi:hypothetical protein [Limnobacter sp.]|uniref:hypothetical protein n=1 Tax=Limnobacter sp. TaxID=2003368 RepID=UPI00351791E5
MSTLKIGVAVLLMGIGMGSAAQQNIANPLIRPASVLQQPANTQAQQGGAPSAPASPDNAEELQRQAERRITQEDLNIRQQRLNSPVVPQPLVAMFSGMQVTALVQGSVVLRRVETDIAAGAVRTSSPAANNNPQAAQASAAAEAPRLVSRSTAALRLRVGQTMNLNGYAVRARVSGQEVSVDWLSDAGQWTNVYFGALESSHGGVPQVPSDSQLIEPDTPAFDHLVPVLRSRTFSANGPAGGGTPGGFGGGGLGGGFPGGGGAGGFPGASQPGFGTGFPN